MTPKRHPDLQEALQLLGAKRVEAALLASLVKGQALGTRDLLHDTGLRQPEVSVGMQALRHRSWVAAEPMPRHGKGRPMHKYTLVADPGAIRKHYEEQGKKRIDSYKFAIDILRKQLS